jgi:hypothetical protein
VRNQNRQIDKTFLSLDSAEERGLLHRDYLAHCLRWSHVVKFLNKNHRYKDAIVLDVGCGVQLPLAKTLYVNKMTPLKYIGVDCNNFDVPEMLVGKKIPITIWPKTDFCALEESDVWHNPNPDGPEPMRLPNITTCFEVLEHVTPLHCRQILQHFLRLTSDDCNYFVSTPCYNGSAAGNHIQEMGYLAFGALLEDVGFSIKGVYGTFASISDYESQLSAVETFDSSGKLAATTDLRPIFSALRNYYDTNVLSVIFAPLFPDCSRNALWHLTKKQGDAALQERLFSALDQAPTPWSQHPDWRQLSGIVD